MTAEPVDLAPMSLGKPVYAFGIEHDLYRVELYGCGHYLPPDHRGMSPASSSLWLRIVNGPSGWWRIEERSTRKAIGALAGAETIIDVLLACEAWHPAAAVVAPEPIDPAAVRAHAMALTNGVGETPRVVYRYEDDDNPGQLFESRAELAPLPDGPYRHPAGCVVYVADDQTLCEVPPYDGEQMPDVAEAIAAAGPLMGAMATRIEVLEADLERALGLVRKSEEVVGCAMRMLEGLVAEAVERRKLGRGSQ